MGMYSRVENRCENTLEWRGEFAEMTDLELGKYIGRLERDADTKDHYDYNNLGYLLWCIKEFIDGGECKFWGYVGKQGWNRLNKLAKDGLVVGECTIDFESEEWIHLRFTRKGFELHEIDVTFTKGKKVYGK